MIHNQILIFVFLLSLFSGIGCAKENKITFEGNNFEIKGNASSFEWAINGSNIFINMPRNEEILEVENRNDDSLVEIWVGYYEAEEFILKLYQVDLNNKSGITDPVIEVESNIDSPLSVIRYIEEDGNKEIVVKRKSHSLYGTLYEAGDVYWYDFYKLNPVVNNNIEHLDFYINKKKELEKEIARLVREMQKLTGLIESISDEADKIYYNVKVNELRSQKEVYEKWIQKINEYLRNKENRGQKE